MTGMGMIALTLLLVLFLDSLSTIMLFLVHFRACGPYGSAFRAEWLQGVLSIYPYRSLYVLYIYIYIYI